MRKLGPALQLHGHFLNISIAVALVLAACPVGGQPAVWELLMDQGNQAFDAGDPFKAEARYREALQVASGFTRQDLRRAAASRNLAQALIVQGRYREADALYQQAIRTAGLTLDPTHPYLRTLLDEQALLRQTLTQAQQPEMTAQERPSLQDRLRVGAEWVIRNSSIRIGAALPAAGEIIETNEQGLAYGLQLLLPLVDLGPLAIGLGLEHLSTTLPVKRSLDQPFAVKGTSASIAPALGPLTLAAGLGAFQLGTGTNRDPNLGLAGGLGFTLGRKRIHRNSQGISTTIHVQAIHIPDATPIVEGSVTLLRVNLALAWRME